MEEVRFLVQNSQHPVIVYSDAAPLVNLLGKDDSKGRIAGWRVRISEYNIEPKSAKVKEMAIADGLPGIPYDQMDEAWTRDKEWENVCIMDSGEITCETAVRDSQPQEQHTTRDSEITASQHISKDSDVLTYQPGMGTILNGQILACIAMDHAAN